MGRKTPLGDAGPPDFVFCGMPAACLVNAGKGGDVRGLTGGFLSGAALAAVRVLGNLLTSLGERTVIGRDTREAGTGQLAGQRFTSTRPYPVDSAHVLPVARAALEHAFSAVEGCFQRLDYVE